MVWWATVTTMTCRLTREFVSGPPHRAGPTPTSQPSHGVTIYQQAPTEIGHTSV